jgi:hypothetical protein
MPIQGKGFFIFVLRACEGGNPVAIQLAAQAAGLSHVIVKIADGPNPFGVDPSGLDYTLPVVQTLHAAGITVWGWHSVYGDDPEGEAVAAIQRLQLLGLDGYVVNAGAEYEEPGKAQSGHQFMDTIRNALNIPIALNSYRFPNYHRKLPWAVFLEGCDYHMPQVYWEPIHNPGSQLRESKRQCDALPHAKPYLASGAAYGSPSGWMTSQADLVEFLGTAHDLGIQAVNFFSWDECRANLPLLWETVSGFTWPLAASKPPAVGQTEPEAIPQPPAVQAANAPAAPAPAQGNAPVLPDAFTAQFMAALNSRQPTRIAALYGTEAMRVRADQTIQGLPAIQMDYDAFFASLPIGATFNLVNVGIQGVVRYLTWEAGGMTGLTTLVVEGGKITLDYTLIA